jgi:hypothetical protein
MSRRSRARVVRLTPRRRSSALSPQCAARASGSRGRAPHGPSSSGASFQSGRTAARSPGSAGRATFAYGAGRGAHAGRSVGVRGWLSRPPPHCFTRSRHAAPPARRVRGSGRMPSGQSRRVAWGLPNQALQLTSAVRGVPWPRRPELASLAGRLAPAGGGAPWATVSGQRRSQLSADPLCRSENRS